MRVRESDQTDGEPDTIVAVSTPRGPGAVALLRFSGPAATTVAARLFHVDPPLHERPRYVCHGYVTDRHGRRVDTALGWFLKAPRSYTGEDTVEVSTHGSEALTRVVVEAALHHGARLAEPGEFTRRAFLNGRLDLLQAEAVADLIRAGGRTGLQAAYGAASGALSARVNALRRRLVGALSVLEGSLDFSEEIAASELGAVDRELEEVRRDAISLVDTFVGARGRREGWRVVLAGRPNAGKSTLMNALLEEERAIVADLPGTTRDWLEAQTTWSGEFLRLVDTAGLREAAGRIEQKSVSKAYEQIADADVVVVVVDGSEDRKVREVELPGPCGSRIIALSKIDLPRHVRLEISRSEDVIPVSARTGEGLAALREAVISRLAGRTPEDGVVLLRERQHEILQSLRDALGLASEHLATQGLELAAAELHGALRRIGELLGEDVDDQVLDRIFSEFCIGK